MILLVDLAFWTMVSAVAQAFTGCMVLVISVITLLQGKKIKELTDITLELKNQTEFQRLQYELEASGKIPNFQFNGLIGGHVIGIFFSTDIKRALESTVVLELINLGASAHNVSIVNDKGNFMLTYVGNRTIHHGARFDITLSAETKDNPTIADYEHCYFELFYKDYMDRYYSQQISLNPITSKHDVKPPKPSAKD